MTRERLLLLLQVLRALGATKTAYALLGLYAIVCGILWLVSHGFIAPDGSMDLRLWVNGRIIDFPKIQAWWLGAGLGSLPLGFGLYGRAVATGPLLSLVTAARPWLLEATRAAAPREPRPASDDPADPVVLRPAASGLGVTATTVVAAVLAGGQKLGGGQ